MYQTTTISNRIVNLGTRSYRQRLEALSGNALTYQKLERLNNDLDELYEVIYSQFNSISDEDVRNITPLLNELLKTIKALHTICRHSSFSTQTEREVEKLGMNYSALYELNSDLQNYRLSSEHDSELMSLLSQASSLMKTLS